MRRATCERRATIARASERRREVQIRRGLRAAIDTTRSLDQNPDRQLDGVPLDRTFTDSASGRSTTRPQLEAMLAFVRDGDTVVVHSMDRLVLQG